VLDILCDEKNSVYQGDRGARIWNNSESE